jgi:hypothetical protein
MKKQSNTISVLISTCYKKQVWQFASLSSLMTQVNVVVVVTPCESAHRKIEKVYCLASTFNLITKGENNAVCHFPLVL